MPVDCSGGADRVRVATYGVNRSGADARFETARGEEIDVADVCRQSPPSSPITCHGSSATVATSVPRTAISPNSGKRNSVRRKPRGVELGSHLFRHRGSSRTSLKVNTDEVGSMKRSWQRGAPARRRSGASVASRSGRRGARNNGAARCSCARAVASRRRAVQ